MQEPDEKDDPRDSYSIDDMARNEGVSLDHMIEIASEAERDGAGTPTVDEIRNQEGVEEVRSEDVVGTSDEPKTDSPW